MKILHIANFNLSKYGQVYYATDRKISNGLVRNNHFVYDFSYRDVARSEGFLGSKRSGQKKMNQRIIDTIYNIEPDFILLGHSEIVDSGTLASIKTTFPDTPIAMWYVDPLFHQDHIQHITERREYLDAIFFTTGGKLLEQFRTDRNKIYYMPNPVDASIEIYHNEVEENLDIDLLFCGRDKGEPERIEFLTALRDRLSDINFVLRGSLGSPLALGAEYMNLLQRTKMGLNLSRRHDVYLYSSDRIAQLTGNGILTLTPETPGMRRLYDDNEVIYFSNLDDLIDKIDYLSQNDSERRRIAALGREKSHHCFNSTRISKFILEASMDHALTESYEWID